MNGDQDYGSNNRFLGSNIVVYPYTRKKKSKKIEDAAKKRSQKVIERGAAMVNMFQHK